MPTASTRPPATAAEGRILCATSVLFASPNVIYAWLCGERELALLALVQLVLSVNFWRAPEWGLRRILDI
eukprot:7150957-Prymnesium_polylepis.2